MKNKPKRQMNDASFADLLESLDQALEHSKGKRDLRTTSLPRPPRKMSKHQIVKVRNKLNISQAVFAIALNVSIKTIQAWEQGLRVPSDAALKLLSIAEKRPEVLMDC